MSTLRNREIAAKMLEFRDKLWSEYNADDYWERKGQRGFIIMPRTMPLILQIMDALAKGKPVSRTYLDVWCRTHNESVVKLDKPKQMAFYSGFSGQRGEQAWKDRMRTLHKLGFINIKPGSEGLGFAVVLNAHKVIAKHRAKRTPGFPENIYSVLLERGTEIKAK